MMKRKGLVLCLVLAALLLLAGFAAAESTDPIVTAIELAPSKLTGPGPVNVTITISNSGDTDLTEPVVLYDPAAQIVTDFGTDGAALLKAGETMTWTGVYDVNQRALDNGSVVFFVKYTLLNDSGKPVEQSQSIRAKISLQTAETDIEVRRTISPTIAREGQDVVVRYDIMNTGTVSLLDVTLEEKKDISAKKPSIPELKPGQTAEIKFPVKMGKKDLTSGAKITYHSATQKKTQTYTVENQAIKFGVPSLEATLGANAKGVIQDGVVTLKLTLKNTGSVDYSDIRVTDDVLGDVFTNQELKAGKSLELTKEVTVPETMEYRFNISATDATGSETTISTAPLTITAVDPSDVLELTVTATPDRTEVFEQPGHVRFKLEVTNSSHVQAKDVKISHGNTDLYTFASIAPGETRSITRDFALSMAGKYRFTVTATDPLESKLTFESNETRIAFSVPTPAPATPTPVPAPTPEPTFAAATIPPIADASIGTVPKLVQKVLLPIMIAAAVLFVASLVLLLVATKRRHDQKKASEAAIDQLERAKRRDYITPAEEDEEPEPVQTQQEEPAVLVDDAAQQEEAYELPHMKYARSAHPAQPEADEAPMDVQPETDSAIAYDDYAEQDAPQWEESDDAMYEPIAEEMTDEPENAQGYDDTLFRRPEGNASAKRRSRRNRGVDA